MSEVRMYKDLIERLCALREDYFQSMDDKFRFDENDADLLGEASKAIENKDG